MIWGLLPPATTLSTRRTRGLELGAAVRHYNERAVPGLGGLWFGKSLLWALLGVHIARQQRKAPIPVGNAIEALACWQEIRFDNGSDPRIRGQQKLAGLPGDFVPYRSAANRSFYVSQPIRQGMTQPLRALGLVRSASSRFNAFHVAPAGRAFLDASTAAFRPHNTSVEAILSEWVEGRRQRVHTHHLHAALSPRTALPELARAQLRERLVDGSQDPEGAARRQAIFAWVAGFEQPQDQTWSSRPDAIANDHWDDLHTGGLFFQVQDAALALLDAAEAALHGVRGRRMNASRLASALDLSRWTSLARRLSKRPRATLHPDAQGFCDEALAGGTTALKSLVARDGRGLRLAGSDIAAGPAFRGDAVTVTPPAPEEGGAAPPERLVLPPGISARVRNAWALHLDLEGRLDGWLGA